MDVDSIRWILDKIRDYVDPGSGTYEFLCVDIIKHFHMESHFSEFFPPDVLEAEEDSS
jgi:hypothetical protein